MLRVSRWTLLNQIQQGKLRANRLPGRKPNPGRWTYQVSRDDLVVWMVQGGMDLRQVRSVLNPGGLLLLVRTDPHLQTCLSHVATRGVPSLFHLGRQVAREPSWGVVVDLPAIGTTECCQTLRSFAKESDRPELIGLHGDDISAAVSAQLAETFDAVIPKILPAAAQAKAIMRLCPARPGRIPP